MSDNVVPLRFNVEEVGKHVKSSKKRFTWDVSLGSKQHTIVLDFSFISGKVKVTVDRKILLQNQLPANTSFQYPFTLDGNSLNVIQQGESFELRINNKVFSHLYNQMKTNKEFKKYEDQVKDFKVNESQFQAKKLTLNIGGVGGMKKKPKQQPTDGHNWNAFSNDEMNGFPNYFQNQSVSTNASTQKIEQPPKKINQKKLNDNLLEDSDLSSNTIKQQKFQNILDFEAQIQNTPNQIINTKPQDQFSTMQLMFQTMGMNPSFQQNKPSVTIDSNEVDFFNTTQQTKTSQIASNPQQQPTIDFFAQVSKQPANDFNTMRNMFNTNTPNGQNNLKQFSLDTSSVKKPQPGGSQFGWNGGNSGKYDSALMQSGTAQVDAKNYSTLQGLFATNVMTGNQQVNVNNNQQNIKQESIQNSFSLNTQQFATQQLPTQSFTTSINVNAQSFGTQQFLNQGFGTSQLNLLNQQNTSFKKQPQKSITQNQQTITQPQQTINQYQNTLINFQPQVNTTDFNSMQYLFKTNTNPIQQNNQQQFPIQSIQVNMQKSQSFNQQFLTTNAVSTQSPNMMFMNTYGGSANGNTSFDMGLNQQQFATSTNQQFATSGNQQFSSPINQQIPPLMNQQFTSAVNPSMIKKKAPQASGLEDWL